MSQVDLFSLRPLLSFESLLTAKNKDLFNIDNVDDFEILSWTAGGRFDGREFVVIACKSKATLSEAQIQSHSLRSAPHLQPQVSSDTTHSALQSQSQSQLPLVHDASAVPTEPQSSSQQYLIIRSVNALPQKLRSKYRRRSKRKHAQLVKDSNIQHLYGDTYHIDVDDDDQDARNDKELEDDDEEESDGIHSVSSIDSEPPDFQHFGGKNFGREREPNVNYSEYDELPVLRIITWFKQAQLSSDKGIIAMDLNPSGSWLQVTCADCSVYLLPLRNLLEIPTHQLELSIINHHHSLNKTEDDFFEQQFGFVNTWNDIKRGGMIRSRDGSRKREHGELHKIASTSLAHLVLHRGKSNKTKSKKGLFGSTASWFSSKKLSSIAIRNGHDTSEELDDAVCADGHESFGALHDLTVLSHGLPRVSTQPQHSKRNKKKKHKHVHTHKKRLICANCSVWWKTRQSKDYVIFGTNDGRICLINVRSHKKTWIEIGDDTLEICDFELIIDIKSTSMLIHCSKSIYYILLLERPFKKDRASHQSLTGALSAQMSQELLMAGYLLNASAQNEDPSTITAWDTIVDDNHYTLKAFQPYQLNIDGEISLSVYHNTGSVIADPHQQTPTPSEKAARMLGLPYPRRRIVASSNTNTNTNHKDKGTAGLSSISSIQNPGHDTYDPLRTEHAQSCVHFGVFYHKQSKLALHALDEIYQPPRAGFKVQSSLKNVFAHNFIISLAPNQQLNQISIIAPPLASLMSGMHEISSSDEEEEEIVLDSSLSHSTQNMLTDTEDDHEEEEEKQNELLKTHSHKYKTSKSLSGVIQSLILDADEKVVAILDRTTSVIMSSPKIYIERLDPLALSQLNADGTDTFDVTITPTVGKSEIPYGATHSVWNTLKSPFLLLLTNKGVYQIDKQFDGFSTVLDYVEAQDIHDTEYEQQTKKVVHGLAACCEVNSKSIYEIAADRMLAHNSKLRDATRSFELYCGSSVTVAKLVRQFLRPEWLHDAKHDVIVNKIFGIIKRLLTTADIPSRITFSDIMFNLLLLQYLIHHPLHEQTQLTRKKLIHFIGLNRECSLKMVIQKLLNINEQELALHVLKSHDDPNAIRSDPIGILTDYFLSITSTLGIQLEMNTASFIIHNYPLLFLEKKLDLRTIPSECCTDMIIHMLDKVVQLCGNTTFAQKYYQTQQMFRHRKQQMSYQDEEYSDDEDEDKDEEEEEEEEDIPPKRVHKLPKSFQEETRMRQKQVVHYLADNIKWLSLEQLVTIHEYLTRLKSNILEQLAPPHDALHANETDQEYDIAALSWSTPGWLLLHLKVLLRIRYVNRVYYSKWDKFGNDEYYTEFEQFIDEVLSKFTGMLDITLILDEMLRYNDLPMAMLLHNKLSNVHDYVITYIRFLLQQYTKHKNHMLSTDKEYREEVLNRIIQKLLLFECNRNPLLLSEANHTLSLSHAQGRCLAHLIALWMRLKLPLSEIEEVCVQHFEALKHGLVDVLFNHWSNHQSVFRTQDMPNFSPKLMLKITEFALMSQ
eukprot:27136_1